MHVSSARVSNVGLSFIMLKIKQCLSLEIALRKFFNNELWLRKIPRYPLDKLHECGQKWFGNLRKCGRKWLTQSAISTFSSPVRCWGFGTGVVRIKVSVYLEWMRWITQIDVNCAGKKNNKKQMRHMALDHSAASRKHAYIILTPLNPLLYSKTGIYRGIHDFSYFCSKDRLWVLVRNASSRRF